MTDASEVPPDAPAAPSKVPNIRGRSWIFTHNNYTEDDVRRYDSLKCERICVGKEVAPTTGTPHLQGFVRFKNPVRLSWWKNQFPKGSFRLRLGSEAENEAYCSKGGNVVINRGTNILDPSPGEKRSRDEIAAEIMQQIEGGYKYGEIRRAHPSFVFWYRRHVIDYIRDEKKLRLDEDYDPSDERPW